MRTGTHELLRSFKMRKMPENGGCMVHYGLPGIAPELHTVEVVQRHCYLLKDVRNKLPWKIRAPCNTKRAWNNGNVLQRVKI
jgi:hypothetical protein